MRDTPKPLLSLHRKGQLAGCTLVYMLYFCVSKTSSGRRLHEAETVSRLTNGSCAMSLNSNHVLLSTIIQRVLRRKTPYTTLRTEKTRPRYVVENRGKLKNKTRCFLCNLYNNVIIYKIKKVVKTGLFVNEFTEFSYSNYKGINY